MYSYHCLAFRLSTADIIHHLVFVTICCGLAIPYKHHGGVANNVGCFVLSGLPGGLDYAMLVLVKHGKMSKFTEKKWNARLQGWLRGPPMAVCVFLVCFQSLSCRLMVRRRSFFLSNCPARSS